MQRSTAHERGRVGQAVRRKRSRTFLGPSGTRPCRRSLRPTTWVNYRDYLDAYVIPVIGDTAAPGPDARPPQPALRPPAHEGRVTRRRRSGAQDRAERAPHAAPRARGRRHVGPRAPQRRRGRASRPESAATQPTSVDARRSSAHSCDHVHDDRFFALWLLVATTGLRRGELAGLRRHDIDFVHDRVIAVVTPGRRGRAAHRSRRRRPALAIRSLALDPDDAGGACWTTCGSGTRSAQLLGQDTQLLFVWPNGQPLHPDTITALFHKHCAGGRRCRASGCTMCRHSYATAALHAGVLGRRSSASGSGTPTVGLHDADLHARDPRHGRRTPAVSVASLILGRNRRRPRTSPYAFRTQRTRRCKARKALTWAKAQVSDGSGGRI